MTGRSAAIDAFPPEARLEALLAAGRQALADGKRRTAHLLWRAAATSNPYDERVWVSLLDVLDERDDLEVCLENIIAINPLNIEARRRLHSLRHAPLPAVDLPLPLWLDAATEPVEQSGTLRRAVVTGVGIGVLAIALGVLISVIVYGGILTKVLP